MDKEKRPDPRGRDFDFDKFEFSKPPVQPREAPEPSRTEGLYMSARDYYLAKRGDL